MTYDSHNDFDANLRIATADEERPLTIREKRAAWQRRIEDVADQVLEAYGRWDGWPARGEAVAHLHPAIVPWSPGAGRALVTRAAQMQEAPAEALALVEAASQLDPAATLEGLYGLKAGLYVRQGRNRFVFAERLYGLGCELAACTAIDEATQAYQAAARLDPDFLWPDNNLAWLLATSPAVSPQVAPTALPWALRTCAAAGWNYWAFLGTLAAAYAAAGDFERAAAWQQVTVRLAPAGHRADAETSLQSFEANFVLRDPGFTVAAGQPTRQEAPSETRMAGLRGALRCLIDLPTAAMQ